MPQSLTDTITLGASVVTILGGVGATLGAFARWRARQKPPAPPPQLSRGASTSPAATVKARAVRPPSVRPPAVRPPAVRQLAQRAQRGVSHPVILGFALAGLLAVIIYSIEALLTSIFAGSASPALAASGSPLSSLNAVLITLNLVCVIAVGVAMMVTAYRLERPGWVALTAITLLIALLTLGIFSVVALAPAVYYGLSGPRSSR